MYDKEVKELNCFPEYLTSDFVLLTDEECTLISVDEQKP